MVIKDINDKYLKKVYLGESKIAGKGLFAGENIVSGEIILIFGGLLSFKSERRSDFYLHSTCIGITEDILLGEPKNSEKQLSDYINHSCDPNVGLDDAITLVALRDISEGEEILCDYAFWEEDESWRLKCNCNCGSTKCRKVVTGQDWRLISKDEKIFRFYSPFIKRRILSNEKK